MNKSLLAQAVKERDAAGMNDLATVTATERVVEHVLDVIADEVKKGGKVCVSGFGTFSVSKRQARMGRNPHTGEPMQIPASNTVRFKPSKALVNSVN